MKAPLALQADLLARPTPGAGNGPDPPHAIDFQLDSPGSSRRVPRRRISLQALRSRPDNDKNDYCP